jgi:Asp-tRNA(Asn)/Glu-tRNA(Gln) amidotransferase A subunit family amidase
VNDTELLRLEATQLASAYAAGRLDPGEVTDAVLRAAEGACQRYHALTCLNADDARQAARASAARWRAGQPLSALDGVPITFKDSFNIAGLPRWHGSAVNTGALSSADAAPVLPRLSYGTPVDAATATAVQRQAALLGDLGAELTWLDDFDLAAEDYQAVYHVMVHKGLAELYAQPAERRARVLPQIGAMLDAALLQTALEMDQVQRRIAQAVARLERQLAPFDFVLSPALPVRHFAVDAISPSPHLGAMSHMGFACWFNQLGRPAGSVPVYQPADGGCPVSVQIAGRRFDDSGVLQLLALLERQRGFAIDFPVIAPWAPW